MARFKKADLTSRLTEARKPGKPARSKKRLTEARKKGASVKHTVSNDPIPW